MTYKGLSYTGAAMEEEDLAFTFVLDKISTPRLSLFLLTEVSVFLRESFDHISPKLRHNQAINSPLVNLGSWQHAIFSSSTRKSVSIKDGFGGYSHPMF